MVIARKLTLRPKAKAPDSETNELQSVAQNEQAALDLFEGLQDATNTSKRLPVVRTSSNMADDVSFDPTIDIAKISETESRSTEALTHSKPNELSAIIPKHPGTKLTVGQIKSYLLLHDYAIEQNLRDGARTFSVIVGRLEREGGFSSKERQHLKATIRSLIGTVVEWNDSDGTVDDSTVWQASGMLSQARFFYDRHRNLVVEWQYADALLERLRSIDSGYFRMHLKSLRETRTFAGQALYLYLSRYKNFAAGRTKAKPWRQWVPILTGRRLEDYDEGQTENVGNSWRYFSRDVVRRALAEVNSIQSDYRAEAVVKKLGARVTDLHFVLRPLTNEVAPTESDYDERQTIQRLVALEFKQRDALRLFRSRNFSDLLRALNYVEARLNKQTGHVIKDKQAYFRSILAKILSGELKDQTEISLTTKEAERLPEKRTKVVTSVEDYFKNLRTHIKTHTIREIKSVLARGESDQRYAEMIEKFVREKLPTMMPQSQRAWAKHGLSHEMLLEDVATWLASQYYPIPETNEALHELGVELGVVYLR